MSTAARTLQNKAIMWGIAMLSCCMSPSLASPTVAGRDHQTVDVGWCSSCVRVCTCVCMSVLKLMCVSVRMRVSACLCVCKF